MPDRRFAVRPSGSRFYPWEWLCLLRAVVDGRTKPCGFRRLTKTRAEAEGMAGAHHNNLHPESRTPAA